MPEPDFSPKTTEWLERQRTAQSAADQVLQLVRQMIAEHGAEKVRRYLEGFKPGD